MLRVSKILCVAVLGSMFQGRAAESDSPVSNRDWALLDAIQVGNTTAAKESLKHGANANAKSSDGRTALLIAIDKGQNEIAKALIESGANLDTALNRSVAAGNVELANLLLEKGVSPNSPIKNPNTYSPLMTAAEKANLRLMQILIDKGADVNQKNTEGVTSLEMAAASGNAEAVKLLIDKGANAKQEAGGKALLSAVSDNDSPDIIKLLLDAGAGINTADKDGVTALVLAAQNSHTLSAKVLIERGADIELKGRNGTNAMAFAKGFNNLVLADLLTKKTKGGELQAPETHATHPSLDGEFIAAFQAHDRAKMEALATQGANVDTPMHVNGMDLTPLIVATISGDKQCVEFLIQRGADLNAKTPDKVDHAVVNAVTGESVLMTAINNKHLDIAKLLIDKGADVSAVDSKGNTAVSLAVHRESKEILEQLQKHGAKVSTIDWELLEKKEKSAAEINNPLNEKLFAAVQAGDSAMLKKLIAQGARAKGKASNILEFAVTIGNVDALNLLLESGISQSNTNTMRGAIENDQLEIVKAFLAHGTQVTDQDMITAAHGGHVEIEKQLIAAGGNPRAAYSLGWTDLMLASAAGDLERIKSLINDGARIDQADRTGETALTHAVHIGRVDAVKLLLDSGAAINPTDRLHIPLLYEAIRNDQPEIVEALLNHGADPNVKDSANQTVLFIAMQNELPAIVKLLNSRNIHSEYFGFSELAVAVVADDAIRVRELLGTGIDVNALSNTKETALMLASKYGRFEAAKLLLEKGADLKVVSKEGLTALMLAAEYGHAKIMQVFLDHGADPLTANNAGDTALTLATGMGFVEASRTLLDKGVNANQDSKGITPLTAAINGWAKWRNLNRNNVRKKMIDHGMDDGWGQHAMVVELLMKSGADVETKNRFGLTALQLAITAGAKEIADLLRKGGAKE